MYYFISPFYFKVPFYLKDYLPGRVHFTIEVGFGNGDFLIQLASLERNHGFLGVEISSRSVLKLTRKLMAKRLDNVKTIKIDAFLLFSVIEPMHSVERIIYNFPDPWPSHPERRVTAAKNLLLVHRALRRDGAFYLATDADILKEDLFSNSKGIFRVYAQDHPFFPFYTKYQSRWEREGRKITYYKLIPLAFSGKYPGISYKKGGYMAHVIFEIIEKKEVQMALPKRIREGNLLFYIEKPYKRGNELLFPVLVKEEGFVQKTYFKLYTAGKEARMVLDDTSYLVVTKGIRKAMAYLRDLLQHTGGYRVKRDTTIV